MFDKHNEQNKEKINIFKNAYSFLYMILKIDDKEKVEKYKKEAQKFIISKYNWDVVVDKTLSLYTGKLVK